MRKGLSKITLRRATPAEAGEQNSTARVLTVTSAERSGTARRAELRLRMRRFGLIWDTPNRAAEEKNYATH